MFCFPIAQCSIPVVDPTFHSLSQKQIEWIVYTYQTQIQIQVFIMPTMQT